MRVLKRRRDRRDVKMLLFVASSVNNSLRLRFMCVEVCVCVHDTKKIIVTERKKEGEIV